MARISELVKTYRLINDPNAPAWSIKFVGGLAIMAVGLAALGAAVLMGGVGERDAPAAAVQTSAPATPEGASDSALVERVPAAELLAWKAAHPDARILSETPVLDASGAPVAYDVRYVE